MLQIIIPVLIGAVIAAIYCWFYCTFLQAVPMSASSMTVKVGSAEEKAREIIR